MRHPAPKLRLLAPAVVATFALAACGGGSSDGSSSDESDGTDTAEPGTTPGGNDPMPGGGEDTRDLGTTPTWLLDGRFGYDGSLTASATQVSNVGNGDFGILTLSTAGFDDANGAWSGSAVSVQHSLDGDGTYTIVDIEGFSRTIEESPGTPVVRFTVQAGTIAVNGSTVDSTQWEAAGGTLEVVVDDDDVYHFFTDEPIPMRVTLDTGAGIPDRPDDTTVTFDNVHGRPAP